MKLLLIVVGLWWSLPTSNAQKVEGKLENITARTATIALKVSTLGNGYDYNSVYANVGYYDLNHERIDFQSIHLNKLTRDLDVYRKEITLKPFPTSVKFVKFFSVTRTAWGGKADEASAEKEVSNEFIPVVDKRPDVRDAAAIESYKENKNHAAQKAEHIYEPARKKHIQTPSETKQPEN